MHEISGDAVFFNSFNETDQSGLSTVALMAALQAMPDNIFMFGPDRRLVYTNIQGPESNLVLTRKGSFAPGTSCCEMFWHKGTGNSCFVDRALESGQKVEFELAAGDGVEVPILLTAQVLEVVPGMGPAGVLVSARDISELRRAEAEALSHKSFLASIADRSPDEIYALDQAGRIYWVNERAEAGRPQMLVGQRLIDFVAADSQPVILDALTRAFNGDETQKEIKTNAPDETSRDVEANTSPLWKDGEVQGALVFFRDITERKHTQELVSQSDKLRAVGELAAGVAHNLNNSLTVIKGRTQLLAMRTTDENSLKSLRIIDEAVEDGSKTLRRILEFARRDSIQQLGPVELDDLIRSSIEIARPKWQHRTGNTSVEVRLECNGPIYVRGDLAELREVVLNLIFNAVDAMPDGGIMEVGTRGEIESGCFWVADNGCGMSPETTARIFEPFFTTKGAKGTGLGLSASHGIITRHQGEIFAVSEPGEGTRFEVRLRILEQFARHELSSESEKVAVEV